MDDRLRCLTIEKMTNSDVDGVAALEKEVFSTPWSHESIEEELANPLAQIFVAKDNGRVIGYIGMHFIIDEGYITNIAVSENYRRNGIATTLLRKVYRFAKEQELAFLSLEVRKSNDVAIRFYEREGFDIEGERIDFYSNPVEDGYIMTKRF